MRRCVRSFPAARAITAPFVRRWMLFPRLYLLSTFSAVRRRRRRRVLLFSGALALRGAYAFRVCVFSRRPSYGRRVWSLERSFAAA